VELKQLTRRQEAKASDIFDRLEIALRHAQGVRPLRPLRAKAGRLLALSLTISAFASSSGACAFAAD
jgi:hypothetical protein